MNQVAAQSAEGQFQFDAVLTGLLRRILDTNKRVQEAACSAFATLEEVISLMAQFMCGSCVADWNYFRECPSDAHKGSAICIWILYLFSCVFLLRLFRFWQLSAPFTRRLLKTWLLGWKSYCSILCMHLEHIRYIYLKTWMHKLGLWCVSIYILGNLQE